MANGADFTVELIDKVTRPSKGIVKAVRDVQSALKSVGNVSDPIGAVAAPAMHALAVGLAAAAAAAGVAAVAAGVLATKFTMAAVEAAAFGQKSRLALNLLIGSETQAAQEFDKVRFMAQGLGLDIEDTQKAFQKLLAAQFSIGESKELIKMGSDLQAIGASAENVNSVLLAMTKIKAAGRLQGDELMMLQEAGVSMELVFDALGKRLGKTKAELLKMQRAGELTDVDAIAAIQEAVKGKAHVTEFGEAGKRFADETLTGMLAQAKGGMKNFFIDIGDEMLPTLTSLAGLVKGTFGKLVESGRIEQLKSAFLDAFGTFAAFIETHWPAIESAIFGFVDFTIAGLQAVGHAFDFIELHWGQIETGWKIIKAGAVVVIGILGILFATWSTLAIGAVAAITAIIMAATRLGQLMSQAVAWGAGLVDGLIGGIRSRLGAALAAVQSVGSTIKNAFLSFFKFGSPPKVMTDIGKGLTGGLGIGMESGAPQLQGSAASIGGVAAGGTMAGAAAGGGGSRVTVHLSVQAPVGGTREDGQRFGEGVVDAIRRGLPGALDGAAVSAGA